MGNLAKSRGARHFGDCGVAGVDEPPHQSGPAGRLEVPQPGGLGVQKAARASGLLVTEGTFLSPCWSPRRKWPPVIKE